MKKMLTGLIVLTLLAGVLTASAMAADTPGDVYGKYLKGCKAGDLSFLKYVTAEKKASFDKMPKDQQQQVAALLKAMTPDKYKLEKEEIKGSKATLTINATQMGAPSKGTVHLKKEGADWKIEKEEWKSKGK